MTLPSELDDQRRKLACQKDLNQTARAMMHSAIMDVYGQWRSGLLTVQQVQDRLNREWDACKNTSYITQLNQLLIDRWHRKVIGFRVTQGVSDIDELVIIPTVESV